MMRFVFVLALGMAACSPQQQQAAAPATPAQPAVAPAPAPLGRPITLKDLKAERDWQHSPGKQLNDEFAAAMSAMFLKKKRPEDTDALKAAGFECIYGEASDGYPDPAAQCTYSFATRACQMDWEVFTTVEKGLVNEVDGSFKRDCVGVEDDWPDPIKSAIDDQLAPAKPPEPPK